MKIYYKVVAEHPEENQIIVRYWTDTISEMDVRSNPHTEFETVDENGKVHKNLQDFFEDGTPRRCRTDVAIDVPVPDPTEKEMHRIILGNAQVHWFKRKEMLMDENINTKMKVHQRKKIKSGVVDEKEWKKIVDPSGTSMDEEELKKLLEDLK